MLLGLPCEVCLAAIQRPANDAYRVNIANAAVFHLKQDLHLTHGQRYNNCLVIFFIPYILFEIPSNLLLKRFKPNIWLSGCMFLFGLVSICQG